MPSFGAHEKVWFVYKPDLSEVAMFHDELKARRFAMEFKPPRLLAVTNRDQDDLIGYLLNWNPNDQVEERK